MRAVVAGVLAALALVAAGCGSSSSTGTAHGATFGADAAKLLPANALAFASLDSNLGSSQWQRVDSIVKTFTSGTSLLDEINSKLQSKGLSWNGDVAPAIGSELDVGVLAAKPKEPEVVAFVHPSDAAKLNALIAKIGHGYTVRQIAGWSVIADSPDSFSAVRAAASGQSLADNSTFQTAWSSLSGDVLAQVYAAPPATATKREADWITADVRADTNALRIDAVIKPRRALPTLTGSSLLDDVPSGAALAISFRGNSDLTSKLSSLRLPGKLAANLPLKQLAPLLAGGGVAYARPNGLFPDVAVELAPSDPQAALDTVRAFLKALGTKLAPLQLTAQVSNGKLVIADSPSAASALRGGAKLVDDPAFKDALASAGVPAQRTFLAYADVAQLAPFVPVVVQAVTGKAPDPKLATTLEHVGSAVAWAQRTGARVELHAWIETR